MRRVLSILLTLVLGVAPSLAAIPAGAFAFGWGAKQEESRLPACCRRSGKHHCNMTEVQARAMQTGYGETTISADGRCPGYPRTLTRFSSQQRALTPDATGRRTLVVEMRTPQASKAAALVSARRSWPKRGPPASLPL